MEHAGIQALKALGDVELPDSKLTHRQREHLKQTARIFAGNRSEHELMFLAGALEHEAQRKAGAAAKPGRPHGS